MFYVEVGKVGAMLHVSTCRNKQFFWNITRGVGGESSLRFIWKGSGKLKLLEISLLSVSLTVIKKCLNDLNNTWFSWQALIALYQAKRRWMLSRKPQVRQADSLLVWHRVPLYRPVFTGGLPASNEAPHLPINFIAGRPALFVTHCSHYSCSPALDLWSADKM